MSVDVVREIIKLKNGYSRMRGTDPATGKKRPDGQYWMVPGKSVPRTTWADVFIVTSHINKYLSPTAVQCLTLPKSQINCDFVRTDLYKAAKKLFDSVSPSFGITTGLQLMSIYPKNEEFWGAANTFAIARSAAGEVPHWDELAWESVAEAAKELPGTIGSALSHLNPKNLIPDLSPIADIIKWGSIGGGLFLLYWYVLRPKKS